MRVRGFGVFLAAVLLAAGLVCAQQARALAIDSPTTIDWLSPEALAWTNPDTFNWSTSPVKLNVHEYGSYNSNVLNAPTTNVLLPGQTRGDYILNTTVGASTKFEAWSQQFFGDASYNILNYRHNVGYDGHNYSLDAGINYVLTSRCTGQVVAAASQRQAPQEQLFGPGITTVRNQSLVETANCKLYQNISAILNSGITSTNQTAIAAPTAAANALDNTTAYLQTGLQYQWTGLDNLQLLTRFSDTRYTNATVVSVADALNATGLLNARYVNYTLVYNRTFSELFNMSATGGLSTQSRETRNQRSGSPATTPIYSLNLAYLPTPKWTFLVSLSRTVSPPVSILAGTQIGNTESFTASYLWTPKLNLSVTLSRNYLAGAPPLSTTITQVLGGFGANTLLSAVFKATYQITPFTSATISAQKSNRTYTGQNVPTEILLFGLDYQPQ